MKETAATTLKQIRKWDADWAVHFPKRRSGRQKDKFLAALTQELTDRGFETEQIQVRQIVLCRNLVTKCESPRVIFMAHYDTPTIIPFWFSWLFRLVGHTRQISGMIVLFVLLLAPWFLGLPPIIVNSIQIILLLSFVSLFITNPQNREDNTSGVIGLMALADWLQNKPGLKKQVQLVFTDNEEWGLLGANGLKYIWQNRGHLYQEAAIINIDCVSRGEVPLLVYHQQDGLANQLLPHLQTYLPNIYKKDLKIVPLSDNYVFRKTGAVNISYADPAILPGGYYIPRIHTPADNDFDAEKLHRLIQGLIDFLNSHDFEGENNL